jgi:hypothetical protein
LFAALGKDKIIVPKLDYLSRDLRERRIDDLTISKISQLINAGKKSVVLRLLTQILGPMGGKELFYKY